MPNKKTAQPRQTVKREGRYFSLTGATKREAGYIDNSLSSKEMESLIKEFFLWQEDAERESRVGETIKFTPCLLDDCVIGFTAIYEAPETDKKQRARLKAEKTAKAAKEATWDNA